MSCDRSARDPKGLRAIEGHSRSAWASAAEGSSGGGAQGRGWSAAGGATTISKPHFEARLPDRPEPGR